ncbi:hypothetical protein EYE35_01100 [Cereibacter sphaeroides]|nr:hypothetical protein EYE35_01100 [Cereibacter sphaeroides]
MSLSFASGLMEGVAGAMMWKDQKQARDREMSIMEEANALRRQRGGPGAGPAAETPAAGAPIPKVDTSFLPLLHETASALEMSPEDLGTIISYETAGTFDPRAKGPRTQWGQHEGLIQFGEPQAKQYGVDWNNALASQLGKEGAVVRYFRENGWKPGMGIEDAYSIVNAGAPGRYNASDAENGGAPGTVLDKVRTQFAPHREKTRALLATYQPAAAPASEGGDGPWRWFQKFADRG